jgi:uracil-DNA glycosylase
VTTAREYVPDTVRTLEELAAAASSCQGCELYQEATQVVFGRGDRRARMVFVGEQPGDVEDQKGLAFVGPAGHLLRHAVDRAGLDPVHIYLTNVVKHFRFETRGRRRIHKTPDRVHVEACRPWLLAEFALLRPEVVVLLGATAAKALIGPSFRVTQQRGQVMRWPAAAQRPEDFPLAEAKLVPTVHPSSVLRADDQDRALEGLVADLRVVAESLRK